MASIASQGWLHEPAVRRVVEALESRRADCVRFVGGCVRNSLLGLPISDIDIATQLRPEDVAGAAIEAGLGVHETGLEHGTLTLVCDHRPFEVTTLRRDVETDGRRAVVAFTEDWDEDAQRRDFRLNALYAAPDGVVFDPTGGGLEDIRLRRIIFVGDPDLRIREDYLRILRFFRFHAWYGEGAPDPAGLEACVRLREGLRGISAERIWMETRKLLVAPNAPEGVAILLSSGVGEILFPELHAPERLRVCLRMEDALGLAPDALRRLAVLMWPSRESLKGFSGRLRLSGRERLRLEAATGPGEALDGLSPAADRAVTYRIGAEAFCDRLIATVCASPADGALERIRRIMDWSPPVFPISGDRLLALGWRPGPDLGARLRDLEDAWIASDFTLSDRLLLDRLRPVGGQSTGDSSLR